MLKYCCQLNTQQMVTGRSSHSLTDTHVFYKTCTIFPASLARRLCPSAQAVKATALLLSSDQYLFSLLGLIMQTPYDLFQRVYTGAKINCYIRHVCPHGTTAAVMIIAICCSETSGTVVHMFVHLRQSTLMEDPAMAKVVSRQSVAAKFRVRSLAGPFAICGAQSDTVLQFPPVRTVPPVRHTHSSRT
jgi:hypothetical protein